MSRVGGCGGRCDGRSEKRMLLLGTLRGAGEWEDAPVLVSLSSLCKCIYKKRPDSHFLRRDMI